MTEIINARMHIGLTGTRRGMTPRQLAAVTYLVRCWGTFPPDTRPIVHHGDCVGADEQFDKICHIERVGRILHPSTAATRCHSEKLRPEGVLEVLEPDAPLARDRVIVERIGLLLAAPKLRKEELRSGTWATVRYAREEGVPVLVLDP